MGYTKLYLFPTTSRGTFDDIFLSKYSSREAAYANNDYVECNFVKDDNGIKHIEAFHVRRPDVKKYHRLITQNPFAGLDYEDDYRAAEMAASLLLILL